MVEQSAFAAEIVLPPSFNDYREGTPHRNLALQLERAGKFNTGDDGECGDRDQMPLSLQSQYARASLYGDSVGSVNEASSLAASLRKRPAKPTSLDRKFKELASKACLENVPSSSIRAGKLIGESKSKKISAQSSVFTSKNEIRKEA